MEISGTEARVPEFSLVRGGPLYNLRMKTGFFPDNRRGIVRRTALLVAVAWLPIMIGAIVEGRLFAGATSDPLLRHFGVHARLLLAIPLLILAEAVMEQIVPALTRQFTLAGLVTGRKEEEFQRILHRAEALRDSVWGKLLVGGSILINILSSYLPFVGDELSWAVSGEGATTRIGFAGWWFVYVGRPIFVALVTLWIWRLFVGWRLISWISKLDLQLVPTHPDGNGGLGFVQQISLADAWIAFPLSVVLASRLGHDVLYHGMSIETLKPLVAVYIAVVLVAFLGPLLLFSRNLVRFRRRALLQYSALVGTQGRLVYRKWIGGEEVGDPPIMDTPELGCVADTNTVFDAVRNMRVVPIGKESVIPLLLATALPMIPVFAIKVPIRELLLKIGASLL